MTRKAPATATKPRFTLDEEQRRQVSDCLKHVQIKLEPEKLRLLISDVERGMRQYRMSSDEASDRSVEEELRELWRLGNDPDSPIAQIRAAFCDLSPRARRMVTRKADGWLPLASPNAGYRGDICAWARRGPPELLVSAAATLTMTGANWVDGQSRGDGRRDGKRWEPQILGHVRGTEDKRPKAGRPRKIREFELVARLANEWERATGEFPTLTPKGSRGFAALVHAVFQWLGLPQKTATSTLVAFDKEMKAATDPLQL
jgi:hypothetical protein